MPNQQRTAPALARVGQRAPRGLEEGAIESITAKASESGNFQRHSARSTRERSPTALLNLTQRRYMTDTPQIKGSPIGGAGGDYQATLEDFEDIDDETSAQLQEFFEIFEEIKQRPDAKLKMAQVIGTLRILAGKKPDSGASVADARGNDASDSPEPSIESKRIFCDFRSATVALLECDDTPRKVCEVVAEMLDELGYECGGHAEPENEYAHRVISKVFNLDDAVEEEERSPARAPSDAPGHNKEIRAEQFTLVDEVGAEHARLQVAGGGAVLTLLDSQGRPRLRLRAGDDEAVITICGERGEAVRGVLSADDQVERLMIGFDSAGRDARIVVNDGNENECVRLSLYGAEGDGFIRLRQPSGGSHTIVDSDGLIAFDGKREPRPEYRDHQAAAPATESAPIVATISPTDESASQLKDGDEDLFDPDGDDPEAIAARELAGAFATILTHREMIPDEYRDAIGDAIRHWTAESYWEESPEVMRRVGPRVLLKAIVNTRLIA
jgi:hypothetical protein